MSNTSKLLKWITFAIEAFFAIPVVGGAFILSNGWLPLGVALLLHVVAIVYLLKDRASIIGNGLGVVTSLVGIIPIVGWIMHGITAIVLLIEAITGSRRRPRF
ncbi:hypothetical protein [Paenibacillus glacialis]|uniref:Uncharacterized protein n=1 Tax=Paenibacillus glacialis TaxID=494026 RepID=A0A168N4K1_9BACL|nr:hypothetical protein [Paenibacillus glacialis]OAB45381.1 hypothetical protein PGLA_03775 [Paenibacillus glacialis]